jgi:hypothetical protein
MIVMSSHISPTVVIYQGSKAVVVAHKRGGETEPQCSSLIRDYGWLGAIEK